MPDHLTTASRRRLLASAGLLTAGLGRASPGGADALRHRSDPDTAVITACSAFNALERRKLGLIEGPGRIADDGAREQALLPLAGEQQVFLDMLCRRHAVTLAGHQARAISFALWDGGELAGRARAHGVLEDRLLAALVRDLAGLPCWPGRNGRAPMPGVAAMARDQPPGQAAGHSRFVVVRDRDGCRKAVARHAVSAVCETEEGGSVLILPGGRMIAVEDDLDTVLQWLG